MRKRGKQNKTLIQSTVHITNNILLIYNTNKKTTTEKALNKNEKPSKNIRKAGLRFAGYVNHTNSNCICIHCECFKILNIFCYHSNDYSEHFNRAFNRLAGDAAGYYMTFP